MRHQMFATKQCSPGLLLWVLAGFAPNACICIKSEQSGGKICGYRAIDPHATNNRRHPSTCRHSRACRMFGVCERMFYGSVHPGNSVKLFEYFPVLRYVSSNLQRVRHCSWTICCDAGSKRSTSSQLN
jgi:hypothetical protein